MKNLKGLEFLFEDADEDEKEALEQVTQDGFALEYVKKQTPEICLAAVKENSIAIQFVKK